MSTVDTSFTIIQAEMPQLELVAPLYDEYRKFYGQPSDVGLARRFLEARIQHRDSVIFLALDDPELSDEGLGFSLLYPSFDSVRATPIWILNDIFVAEDVRRRGVGSALIERGRQLARDTGARGMSLDTARDNEPSHKLYEKMGFERDDVFCTFLLEI